MTKRGLWGSAVVLGAAIGCGSSRSTAAIDAATDGPAGTDGAAFDAAPLPDAGAVLPVPTSGCTTQPAVPTLLAPWSTSTVTSKTPTLRWSLPGAGGAHIDVCADRACTTIQQHLDTTGATSSVELATPLAAGVHFWRVRAAGASTYSPVWELWSGVGSAPTGSASGSTLDVNGDGRADLVVGTDGSNDLALYLGSSTGYPSTPIEVPVPTGASRFGGAVASAGDVNGDGFGDLIVGASDSETAYVFLGGPTGLSSSPITLTAPSDSLFGNAVAGVGDLDGDGFADVAVGTVEGLAVYVYFGSPCGTSTTPLVLTPPDGGSSDFGFAVAGAMDLDGDGFGDLAAQGPGHTVDLYFGAAGGLYEAPRILPPPSSSMAGSFDYFGSEIARAGDVNGDGYDDLAVGATGESGSSTAYVFLGGAGGPATAPSVTLMPPTGSSNFAAAIAGPGDVDGDGYDDLAVGSLSDHVYLFRGGAGGLSTTPVSPPIAGTAGSEFGSTLAAAGDVDNDGRGDLAVSAIISGTVYVYAGSATGLSGPVATIVAPAADAGFSFGYAIACALPPLVPGDG